MQIHAPQFISAWKNSKTNCRLTPHHPQARLIGLQASGQLIYCDVPAHGKPYWSQAYPNVKLCNCGSRAVFACGTKSQFCEFSLLQALDYVSAVTERGLCWYDIISS